MRRDLAAPDSKQVADEAQPPLTRGRRPCTPIEHGRAKGRFRKRIGNVVAQPGISRFELLASAFADRCRQRFGEIAKKRKRLGGSPSSPMNKSGGIGASSVTASAASSGIS